MKDFKVKRISIGQAQLFNPNNQLISTINWPTNRVWSCENAVIGDPYFQNKSLGAYPLLNIDGKKLIARRKLVTQYFFGNKYEVSLWDENNQLQIIAFTAGQRLGDVEIKYNDKSYFLSRKSLFRFYFTFRSSEMRWVN